MAVIISNRTDNATSSTFSPQAVRHGNGRTGQSRTLNEWTTSVLIEIIHEIIYEAIQVWVVLIYMISNKVQ